MGTWPQPPRPSRDCTGITKRTGKPCGKQALKALEEPLCYSHAQQAGLVPKRKAQQKGTTFAPSGTMRRSNHEGKRPAVRCKGIKSNGEPCGQYAMHGQLICKRHGGMTPKNLLKAKERLGEDKALSELARLGVDPVTNALEELQKVAGQVVAWKDRCAAMVNKLREEELRYSNSTAGELLRGEVLLWERSLDRCIQVLQALARCQVEERLTTVKERDAEKIAAGWAEAMAELGVDGAAQYRARLAFMRHLRPIGPVMKALPVGQTYTN